MTSSRLQGRPPRVATILVHAVLPARHRAVYLAELEERFRLRAERHGGAAARRWYWMQAWGFVVRVPVQRIAAVARRDFARSDTARRDTARRDTARNDTARRDSAGSGPYRGAGLFASVGRDLGYAARSLRSRPGFTLPAIAILALAIAANAAVLSIVDNVLLRGLPLPDPDGISMLWDVRPPSSPYPGRVPVSYNHYLDWKDRDDLFEQVVAMETLQPSIETSDYPLRVHGMMVSGDMFAMLGASAALGRTLLPEDDRPGADPTIVISDRFWRRAFEADPRIVGRTVRIDNRAATVVGVMPADFWYFDPYMFGRSKGERENAQPDVFRPLSARDWSGLEDYAALRVMARLRPEVSIEAAGMALAAARAAEAAEAPEDEAQRLGVDVASLSDEVLGGMRSELLWLQAAVTLLLLIACVNVMSLVLAKASAQRSELAVRAALGAGRGALVRLAVAESVLLGAAGGTAGILGAYAIGGVILRIAPRELPLAHRVDIDLRVAIISAAIALAAGLVAGVLPVLSLDFKSLTRSLRSSSRNVAGSVFGSRSRFTLVAAEVAMTLVLLIGATVATRSFIGLWRTDPGFDAGSALTFFSTLSTPAEEEPHYEFHTRLLDELRSIPGVESVGATTHLPFSNWGVNMRFFVGGGDQPLDDALRVDGRWVTEDYLQTMRIAVLAGRGFNRADDASSEPVVIVNRAFADRFFDGAAPDQLVGRSLGVVVHREGPQLVQHRVVGVVDNVKHSRLSEDHLPMMYAALRQSPPIFLRFVVRTENDPRALVPTVRRLAAAIDPRQPLTEIYDLRALVAESLTEERFYAQLLSAFGLVAFGLAAVGVYGSVTYSARVRLREVGVRIAFGAQPRSVRRLIVKQGMLPVVTGIAIGCAGAAILLRGLESLLYGVSAFDPVSFAGGALTFAVAAAIASAIPAWRASTLDPVTILRSE